MKFVTHQTTLHLSFKIKCCVDRLRPPGKTGSDRRDGPGTDIDPSRTVPEAVLTSGLAAIAEGYVRRCRGLYSDLASTPGQPKGADGVRQHGRCERYARARCFR